jgi:hypothetical protein
MLAALLQLLLLSVSRAAEEIRPKLSEERVVFQLDKGDLVRLVSVNKTSCSSDRLARSRF